MSPMRFQTRLSNAALGVVWNLGFRPGRTPAAMRTYFDAITSAENMFLKSGKASLKSETWNEVRVDIVEATPQPTRTILYLHGGGYFMGNIRGYRKQGFDIASQCD